MASKALKGLTIKIGGDTSELTKALDKVDKQSRSLSGELGQINKLLKLDPKNTELLAQKQKVLADAISSTEKKLDTLKEAEKQVQAQFERGEVSEAQYRALQREIIETENKLNKYKGAAKETAEAVKKLANSADDAAEELDDQADRTREADRAAEDLDDSTGDLAKGGLAAMAAAAAAAVTAIVALAEESRQYRTEMAKLDTAFQDANFSTEAATKTYEELQSILGETEQAVEAANNLAALCTTEEELNDWTEILTGVYGKFGASLPVEGLAEAANETKRVGQVTGPLADALNWAAKEGETFGVTLKKNTKANEEWNKKVKEATSAEDYFNLALEQCSNEQERQQLITQTLTKLYGNAATQYKETNKEVIRSNKATEKWNKATAKIGKTVEPVVTDIKELGVALLEDASEPLEDIAKFIRKEGLPAIKQVGSWVKKNLPALKSGLIGAATAMVALKVATIATTVAQKGVTGAIKATTIAQKALNLAQKASPLGIITTALVAVTAGFVAYAVAMNKAKSSVDVLTKEERELMEAAAEAADAFRDQQDATQDAMATAAAESRTVQRLADELHTLADESGRVKDKDKDRAEFILGKLNEALGTEYELVGNTIKNYKDLKKAIDELIQSKLANALLEEGQADYITAQKEKANALAAMTNAEKDYQAQLTKTQEAEADYQEKWKKYVDMSVKYGEQAASGHRTQALAAGRAYEEEKKALEGKKTAYEQASTDFYNYTNTIIDYETAQRFAAEGNYDAVKNVLLKKGEVFGDYGDTVDKETAQVLDTLQMEAILAGEKAKKFRSNFEKGVDGYTEEMVTEAENAYQEALGKFGSAYSDAYGLGEDFGQGLADGIKIKNGAVGAAAIAQIREAVKAAKKEAEINSPSRVMRREVGKQLGEGNKLGIKDSTEDVQHAAKEQMGAVLDTYRAQEVDAQRSLRNLAEQQAARQVAGQMTAATANSGTLDKILQAIKEGQILVLDGEAVVGGTANRMDNSLGMLRVLSARGAR